MVNHSFKRVEKKYLISKKITESLIEYLNNYSDYSQSKSIHNIYNIRTTYFESIDHCIYHMKKQKKSSRFKVRIREYGKNGIFKNSVWIELKEKYNGEGYKNRFKIPKCKVASFLNNSLSWKELLEYNKKIDSDYLKRLYKTVTKLIKEYNLSPYIIVEYSRIALDNGLKGGARITFDSSLKYYKINSDILFKDNYNFIENKKDFVILEVKTNGMTPGVMKDIKKRFGIKRARFSKFIYSMEEVEDSFNTLPLAVADYKPYLYIIN